MRVSACTKDMFPTQAYGMFYGLIKRRHRAINAIAVESGMLWVATAQERYATPSACTDPAGISASAN